MMSSSVHKGQWLIWPFLPVSTTLMFTFVFMLAWPT